MAPRSATWQRPPVILDTGVLCAAVDRSDAWHAEASRVVLEHAGALVAPAPVLVETSWLVESRLGAATESAFLTAVADGEIARVDLDDADWARAAELVGRYADLGLGLVDASVVALAERLDSRVVATVNHRAFRVVRPGTAPR